MAHRKLNSNRKHARLTIRRLSVRTSARRLGNDGDAPATLGRILIAGSTVSCTIGRAGAAWRKREGDGRTPKGRFAILYGFYRADAGPRPFCRIRFRPIRRADGWCDASGHPCYNRLISLPFAASHERLWRSDALYDFLLVLDYNLSPRRQNFGSAIFFHVWKDKATATEGCVAISAASFRRILPRLSPRTVLEIL